MMMAGNHVTASMLILLIALVSVPLSHASTRSVRSHRRLRGSPLQRTTPFESDSKLDRALEEFPPCTNYYQKKSKFNKYDDDWYNPCKTNEMEYPTVSPRTRPPSVFFSPRPTASPRTRPPSVFFSQGPPTTTAAPNGKVWNDPNLEIVAAHTAPSPVVSPQNPSPKPSLGPTLNTINAVSKAPVASKAEAAETEIEVNVGTNNAVKEKNPSCQAAQSGKVIPTSVNFTIYYRYELLVDRDANMKDVVWPEIDRAFQRFLALELIDCEIDVERNGVSPIFATRLKSVSPDPMDSVGSSYPYGFSNSTRKNTTNDSCTHIVIDNSILEEKGLYCDVVTGSVTLYLSELSYMDAANSPSILFLDYRNKIVQTLRDEINSGGAAISNFFEDDLGVRGFYFLSESTELNLKPTGMGPDAASNNMNAPRSSKENSSTTTIAASLAALAVFVMAAAGFSLHHKKKNLNDDTDTLKDITTPRTIEEEMFFGPEEFYGIDVSDDEDNDCSLQERQTNASSKLFSHDMSQTSDCDMTANPVSGLTSIFCSDDRESQLYTSFEYSQLGISVHFQSPQKSKKPNTKETASQILQIDNANDISHRPDPSVATNRVDPEPGEREYPDDESSCGQPDCLGATKSKSMSPSQILSDLTTFERDETFSTSRSSVKTPSKAVNSTLNYILSLGASVMFTPDNVEESEIKTELESTMATITPPPGDSILSQASKSSGPSRLSTQRLADTESSLSSVNDSKPKGEKSVINSTELKTPSPQSVARKSLHDSSCAPPSSGGSRRSQTTYLKNRRRELENRFQNYRRSLSESINGFNDSNTGAWSASREFSRSVSLYKNTTQPMSPDENTTNPIENTEASSATRLSKILCGIKPSAESIAGNDILSDHSPEKSRSRTPKTPRVRKSYTSLNDIEEILDREESRLPLEEAVVEVELASKCISPKAREDSKGDNAVATTRDSVSRLDYMEFQPDTVIL